MADKNKDDDVVRSMILDSHGRPMEFAVRTERSDAWVNGLTGVGTSADKTTYGYYQEPYRLQDNELRGLNDGSDLARKVIWDRPREMFREGYDITGRIPRARKSGNPTDAADDVPESLCKSMREYVAEEFELDDNVMQGSGWGRLFGGCLLIGGIDDGNFPWEPLDEDKIKSFDFLSLVDRRYAYVQSQYSGINAKRYGTAQIYLISNAIAGSGWNDHGSTKGKTPEEMRAGGAQIQLVHSSRCIRFDGNPADVQSRQRLAGWSWSVLQPVYHTFRQFEHAFDSAAYLLSDASQGVLKMVGLMKAISAGNRQAVMDRAMLMELTRSVIRGIVVDAGGVDGKGGEEWERKGTPLGGVADILNQMKSRFAAAANEPQTKLFGQAPAGMDATGESDMRLWYDDVRADAQTSVSPKIRRLYRLVALSKDSPIGGKKVDWTITFKPLWSPTDAQVRAANLSRAQTDVALVGAGIIPEEVASLTWKDEYPALDTESIEESIEAKKSFDPHENDEPEPPPGGLPPNPSGGDVPPNAGPGEPLSQNTPVPPIGPGPRLPKPLPGTAPAVPNTKPPALQTAKDLQKHAQNIVRAAKLLAPAGSAPANRGTGAPMVAATGQVSQPQPEPQAQQTTAKVQENEPPQPPKKKTNDSGVELAPRIDGYDWRYDSTGWDMPDAPAIGRILAMLRTREDGGQAQAVFEQLLHDYPAKTLGWVMSGHWHRETVPLDQIDTKSRDNWRASHDGHVPNHLARIQDGTSPPVILVKPPGDAKYVIVDGHHRFLAHEQLGIPVDAYVAEVHTDAPDAPWRILHSEQRRGSSIGSMSGSMASVASVPAPEPAPAPPPVADSLARDDARVPAHDEAGKFPAGVVHAERVDTPHGPAHVQLIVKPGGEHVFSARARDLAGAITPPMHVRIPSAEVSPDRLEAEANGKRAISHSSGLPLAVKAKAHALVGAMRLRAKELRGKQDGGLVAIPARGAESIVGPKEQDAAPAAASAVGPALPDGTLPLPVGSLGVPDVRQQASFSCGVAATMAVMRYWGVVTPASESDLYSALGTTEKDGTDCEPIAVYLTKRGLDATYKTDCTPGELDAYLAAGATVIVDLQAWGDGGTKPRTRAAGHCVVLVGMDPDRFYFMDPSSDTGYSWLDQADLETRWHDTTRSGEPRRGEAIVVNGAKSYPVEVGMAKAVRMDAEESHRVDNQQASICIVWDSAGRILTVSRPEPPHEQAIPGGIVDPGEGPDTAAARELEEELGVKVKNLRFVAQLTSPVDQRPVQVFATKDYEGEPYAAEAGTTFAALDPMALIAQSNLYTTSLIDLLRRGALTPPLNGPRAQTGGTSDDKPPQPINTSVEDSKTSVPGDTVPDDTGALLDAKKTAHEDAPPSWVDDVAAWEKAKEIVKPKWDDYDQPYAIVATVYKNIVGSKGDSADWDESKHPRGAGGKFGEGSGGGAATAKEPTAKEAPPKAAPAAKPEKKGMLSRLTGAFHTIARTLRENPKELGKQAVEKVKEALKDKVNETKNAGLAVYHFVRREAVSKEESKAFKRVLIAGATAMVAGHLAPLLHLGALAQVAGIHSEGIHKVIETAADHAIEHVLEHFGQKGLKVDSAFVLDADAPILANATQAEAMNWFYRELAEAVASSFDSMQDDDGGPDDGGPDDDGSGGPDDGGGGETPPDIDDDVDDAPTGDSADDIVDTMLRKLVSDWDEEDHPRGEPGTSLGGRFVAKGSGGGGGGPAAGERPAAAPAAKKGGFARLTGAFHAIASTLRAAPAAIAHAALHEVKEKIHDFKGAALGIKNFASNLHLGLGPAWKSVTHEQRAALRHTAVTVAAFVVAGHLTPFLHIGEAVHGAAGGVLEKATDQVVHYTLERLTGKGMNLAGIQDSAVVFAMDAALAPPANASDDEAMDWFATEVTKAIADAFDQISHEPDGGDDGGGKSDAFDPEQPRDEHGQFASGGGGSNGGAGSASSAKPLFSEKELGAQVSQPTRDEEALFDGAKQGFEEQLDLLNRGKGLAKDLGGTIVRGDKGEKSDLSRPGPVVQVGSLKTKARAEAKVASEYGGDWSKVGDIVRSSIAVDSPKEIPGILDKLRGKGVEVVRAKDRISNPTPVGYRDVLLNVKYPSGHVGELQLHIKSMLQAKDGPGHKLYERMQEIERGAKGRDLNSDEQSQIRDLNAKSNDLYGAAWKTARGDAGDWDESKISRDERGRFGEGSLATESAAGKLAGPLAARAAEGGFTYRPGTKTPTDGILVSRAPSEGHGHVVELKALASREPPPTIDQVTAEVKANVKEWIEKNLPAMEKLGPDHFLGGYAEHEKDPKTGQPDPDRPIIALHFDISQRFDPKDRETAIRAGNDRNQISIFDLGKFEEIPTGGTGRGDAGDWDEGQHPRGPDGKFGEGGGTGTDTKAGSVPAWHGTRAKPTGEATAYFKAHPETVPEIKNYTSVGYDDINGYLNRGEGFFEGNGYNEGSSPPELLGQLVASARDHADKLQAALRDAPKTSGEVLRGAMLRSKDVEAMKPGAVIEAKGFWSTTTSTDIASNFAENKGAGWHSNVDRTPAILHVAAKSAVDISGFSGNDKEHELLLSPGVRMQVNSVRKPSAEIGGPMHIYLTEVSS